MTESYPHLFEPIQLASHILKNRIVLAPMKTGFASEHLNSSELIRFYTERAANDSLGMVIIGNNCVDPTGRIHPFDKSTPKDEWILTKTLTKSLHDVGTKVLAQLVHHGNDVRHIFNFSANTTYNPDTKQSGVRLPGFMTDHYINKFVEHAYNAINDGGFDGIEIYGGNRSLPNCFASPALNKRKDKWGLQAGFLFHHRLIRNLRRKLGPDPIIAYRISLMELVPDGVDWEGVCRLTRLLHKLGVNVFSFEIGLSPNQAPIDCELTPPGVWFDYMRKFSLENEVPIIFGKKLPEVSDLNDYLGSTPNSLFEVDRPMIADPNWVNKIRTGLESNIVPCVECPQRCLSSYLGGKPEVHCIANPSLFKPSYEQTDPITKPHLLVVGGGPAGMSLALHARKLGRDVTLVEEREELGGLYRLAASIPGKDKILDLIEQQEQTLVDLGVNIIKEQKVTLDWIQKNYQGANVVLATGTQSRIPDIPGIDSPNVFTFEDLLGSSWSRRRHIAVIGNNSLAMDLARFFCPKKTHNKEEWLNAWGINDPEHYRSGVLGVVPELYTSYRTIYLIMTTPLESLEESLTNAKRHYELDWLRMNGVRTFSNVTVEHIDNNHIRLNQLSHNENNSSKHPQAHYSIPDGFEVPDELVVVIAEGLEARTELAEELKSNNYPFLMTGSVKQKERLWGASLAAFDGYMTAFKIR